MKKLIALLLALMTLLALVPAMAETEEESNVEFVYVDVTYEEEHPEIDEDVPDEEPVEPEFADKYIFGKDNRITIKNGSKYPYTALARMEVKAKCGCSWIGTGFMVGSNNKMLTAAHCLYCTKHSSPAKTVIFRFGYIAKTGRAYYTYSGKVTFYVGTKFKNHSYTIVNDYAAIKFPTNIVKYTGSFGARWGLTNKQLNNKTVYLSGYHSGVLKYGKGKINVLDNNHVKYQIDTLGGSSGCPIYDSGKYAVGINIAGTSNWYGTPLYNVAHRLTNTVRKLFNK